jgi:hypothetical protein
VDEDEDEVGDELLEVVVVVVIALLVAVNRRHSVVKQGVKCLYLPPNH